MAAELVCRINQTKPIPLFVEFRCQPGELLAVVGPSGGGKTTLLRMIAGLSRPQQGEICCGAAVWFNDSGIFLSPQQRHIGYVPQHFGLFPNLSAVENVMSGLDHIPKEERFSRAKEWLERVNLTGMPDRLPSQLSGGQKQRVALARALAREPKVLLLDEPFSAVDRETRERLYIELARLKTLLSIPVVMITHDLNEAMLLADRMLLISHGKMLQQGNPRQVLARPNSEAVARQLGIKNIFSAEVETQDAKRQLTWLKMGKMRIASEYGNHFAIGSKVLWMISNQGVRFSTISDNRLRRSLNKLNVEIVSMLVMGESVRLVCQVEEQSELLHTEVPLNLAQKLKLAVGLKTSVALKTSKIHLVEEL